MTHLLSKLLPIELTNGNDGRGSKWFRSASRRKTIAQRLSSERRKPFSFPVTICITRILGRGQRLWDADSVGRGSAKELLDSLVELGWFVDDGPKWIVSCDYRQDASRRDVGPATLVDVFEEV